MNLHFSGGMGMRRVMKVTGALLSGCLFIGAPAMAGQSNPYNCRFEKVRQTGNLQLAGDARLSFIYETQENQAEVSSLLGFVSVSYLDLVATGGQLDHYTGVFSGNYRNQSPYGPRVYMDHYKFSGFNAKITSDTDGGGMWGYLVVSKNNGGDRIDAHYVFQAGDHMGGTVDLICLKKRR